MEPLSITEPNDAVGEAIDVTQALQGTGEVVLAGVIGDTAGGADDVDLVSFTLSDGQFVEIETATSDPTELDTVLTLFGPDGGEVAFNDDALGSFDSRIVHAAAAAGLYTVGVSSLDNVLYDPTVPGSGSDGFTTGDYDLTVTLLDAPEIDPALAEPNDTIAQAADVTAAFEADGGLVLTGLIGDAPDLAVAADDVDLVTLDLEAGESVRLSAEAVISGADFAPLARVFDAAGAELSLVFLDDGGVGFTAPADGTFAVGVSAFDNSFYDPTIEGSGFDGFDTGFYRLAIEPFDLVLDLDEPNDTRAQAPDLTAALQAEQFLVLRGFVGDNPDLANADDDVDLVSFTLGAGDQLDLFVDAEFLSGLDAVLRVFGPGGEELALSDDTEFGLDPELTFTAPVAGTFTLGVSADANDAYDPDVEGSGTDGFSTGLFDLVVELTPVPVVSVLRGTAEDDRLVGGTGPDDIRGRGGDDDLRGRGGQDELRGGGGEDDLRGGAGDDVLRGGAGDDELRGGPGDDILRGGAGGDLMVGGGGSDTFVLRGMGDAVRGFDVRGDPSETSFDTLILGPGLVLRSARDFFELALSERAGYDLDFDADEAGIIRRADIENARTGETADIEIAGDDMTLAEYVLFQAEQIGLVLP